MEDYRSESCRDGGMMEIERYNGGDKYKGPTSMKDMRSYSTSHASSSNMGKVVKLKKEKKSGVGSTTRSWSLIDPELKRKKRVASYKVYSVEGKMKGSFKKSFRWIKDTYTQVLYGWRKEEEFYMDYRLKEQQQKKEIREGQEDVTIEQSRPLDSTCQEISNDM